MLIYLVLNVRTSFGGNVSPVDCISGDPKRVNSKEVAKEELGYIQVCSKGKVI